MIRIVKKRKVGVKVTWDRRGFMDEVKNPKGEKKSVYIYQGMGAGFRARYTGSQRDLGVRSASAEKLAVRLAKKGHKKVTFRD